MSDMVESIFNTLIMALESTKDINSNEFIEQIKNESPETVERCKKQLTWILTQIEINSAKD